MAYTLPPLTYPYNALEPYIDEATVRLHHDKHHATYVNNLNAALEGYPEWQGRSVEEMLRGLTQVPEAIRTAVKNNAGAHHAHSLYWEVMAPGAVKEPTGQLATAMTKQLGGFAEFKERFAKVGAARFGSGWAWLVVTSRGELAIYSTSNADSPYTQGDSPILVMDVWEHSYYLKYQNRRADYINAFMNLINWDVVGEKYVRAMLAV